MYGSFLYNCWAALIGFTIYFVVALQAEFAMPLTVLIGSAMTAVVLFVLMYGVRYLLGYVLFTPEQVELPQAEESVVATAEQPVELPQFEQISTVEFEDDSSEEIAKVVRTMMHQEQQSVPNA